MTEDTLLPFSLPSVQRKTVTAAFDGGRMTSDGGVMLLAAIETSLGLAARLAPLIADPRNPALVTHDCATGRSRAAGRTACRAPGYPPSTA
jgi:hypothetical protein